MALLEDSSSIDYEKFEIAIVGTGAWSLSVDWTELKGKERQYRTFPVIAS